MLRVVSHVVLSPTNLFQQLCILLFLQLLIVLQICNLLVLVLHMSKNCTHTHTPPLVLMTAITSFAIEINFVTTTQDINSPTQIFQASVVTIKLHLVFKMEYQTSFNYRVVKQLFWLTRFPHFMISSQKLIHILRSVQKNCWREIFQQSLHTLHSGTILIGASSSINFKGSRR